MKFEKFLIKSYNNKVKKRINLKMEENTVIDSLNLNKKIAIEKRKRHQAYMALEYLKSHTKKFDFFSYDSIKIIKTANSLTKIFNQKKVTPEILLLAFFNEDLELIKILKKFNITFEILEEYLFHGYKVNNNEKVNIFSSLKKNFSLFFEKKVEWQETIELNYELKSLIEKAIENTYRFKTPVITPELLFLTLLEEKTMAAGSLLKTFLKEDLEWTLLRYEILKKLHNQETIIQGNVSKNYRFFAYRLKIELNDPQFEKLLETKDFFKAVTKYRDLLILKILEINLFDLIEDDIKISLKINNKRFYSK